MGYCFLAAVPGRSTDIKELNNCLIFWRGWAGTRLDLLAGVPVNARPFVPALFFGLFMGLFIFAKVAAAKNGDMPSRDK